MLNFKEKSEKYFKKNIYGVIHVGAHFGQEYELYKDMEIENILFFEPCKKNFDVLKQYVPDKFLVNKAVGNKNSTESMFVENSNYGQSNSLLKPKKHLEQYPWIKFDEIESVEMVRLDDYIENNLLYNALNIDCQGYELEVLKGSSELLQNIDIINVEVNNQELYENCPTDKEIEKFLNQFGFELVIVEWEGGSWGDALFIKKSPIKLLVATVCVNYSDYLALTWEYNKKILSKFDYWIITDFKDEKTEKFCKENKINFYKTNIFYQNGSSFNKGAALNEFFLSQNIDQENLEWVLLLDSDIILNDSIKDFISIVKEERPGFKENLYSCSRKVYKTKDDYLKGEFWWEICHFIGYFQLFHKDIILEKIKKKDNIFLEFSNSAVYDMEFANSFGSKKIGIASDVCHLGLPCQNWDGRIEDNFFKQTTEISTEEVFSNCATDLNKNDILFKDGKTLKEYVELNLSNISKWAKEKSIIYSNHSGVISKNELEDKSKWYVNSLLHQSTHAKTSGSTTGFAFEYLRYQPFYEIIEFDNHLDLVLDEFNISKDPNIFYFFSHYYEKKDDQFVYCSGGRSPYDWINHGRSRNSIVHYANFDLYKNKTEEFFEFIFEYFENNKIDVFYSSSPEINSMCNYMRKFGFKRKVAYLLSNTSEMLIQEDAHFLFENNHFDHICDHMRCWDGGGSFFTCKYRNYHLMDNLAWCEQGPNNEFICTDYFNLASPFVRYWNGDYCKIDNEYKRCECGRLYREFEFLENRPFSLKGVCFKEIKEKIKELGIEGIKQVRCSPETLDVISSKPLNDAEMQNISMLTDKFQFRFKVEAD